MTIPPTRASNEYHVLALLVRERGGADYFENLHVGAPVPRRHVGPALNRLAESGLVTWHERTGSWRAAVHAAATLNRVDREVDRSIAERAQRDPGTWDANIADPDDLACRTAIERNRVWVRVLDDLPAVPGADIGSVILLPEGHDCADSLAIVVASHGDVDAGEVPRWVCQVWAPGADDDGQRVTISQARAAYLANDPLYRVATAAAVMRLGRRQRDRAIQAAEGMYSQHSIAAAARMSQPGVWRILGRGGDPSMSIS